MTRSAAPFAGPRMLLVAAAGIFLVGPAQTFGVAPFVEPLLATFGWPRAVISTAYALGTLAGAGGVVLSGRLLDRYGHRRVLTGAALAFAMALLAASAIRDPLTLTLGFALLRGAGIGAVLLGSRTLIAQWYVRRRGWALSLGAVAGALSAALFPALALALISRIGWRATWQLSAVVILLVLVPLAGLVVRDRPEQVGQHPDGLPISASSSGDVVADEAAWRPAEALRTRQFWLLLGASMVPGLVGTGLDFNQVALMGERGLSPTVAATDFTVAAAVNLPAALLSGRLVDRRPVRFTLAAGQLLLAVATLCLLIVGTPTAAYLYGALRGLTLGLWAVAIDSAWPTYFGRRYLGGIRGLTFAAEIVGAALGPLPFGLVYDLVGGYTAALLGVATLPLLATALVLAAPPPGRSVKV